MVRCYLVSDLSETHIDHAGRFLGGYPKFVKEGLNEDWLPIHLQRVGYNTYYVGKLFNAHNVDNYNDPYVNGFNQSDFLLDPRSGVLRTPCARKTQPAALQLF